jgi:hypothetical protein
MNDQWAKWVRETTGGASSRVVAGRIDRSHTTALKWMHDPSPEAVMAFAHAYGANVIEALIAAGWLNDVEESERAIVRKLPSVKLAAELYRRALVREQSRKSKA